MSEHSLQRVVPARVAKPNGWWGTLVFVATESTLFGCLFGTYFYLRFKSVHWPPRGIEAPAATLPIVLTAVLVATSVPLLAAARAGARGRLGLTWAFVLVSLVVQAGYFALQMRLFEDDLAKLSPQQSAYGSIYFTLLGAHHAHVAVGMLLELWLLARLLSGLTGYRLVALRSIALYWHFVNLAAVLVVATLLSPSA